MNNCIKLFTNLELLKNRIIYLSTLFKDHTDRDVLRTKINNAWKTIYEYLENNDEHPFGDNNFLRNH